MENPSLEEATEAPFAVTDEQTIGMATKQQAGAWTADDVCRERRTFLATSRSSRRSMAGVDVADARRLKTREAERCRREKLLAEQIPVSRISIAQP